MSCIICGECLENKYSIKLECLCDYQYHYECIATTLKHDKYNRCPYCATPYQLLPLVNGIKKIDNKICIKQIQIIHMKMSCVMLY